MQTLQKHLLVRLLVVTLTLAAAPAALAEQQEATQESGPAAAANAADKTALVPAVKPLPSKEGGLDPDNLPAEMDMSLDELLNDPEGVAPKVDATRCLNRVSRYSTVILDSENLLFKSTTGRRAWLNRLSSECIGLRPSMYLVFESTSSRRCALDNVFGVESGVGSIRSAPCRLGKFEPITKEHALALEDTFEKRGQALAAARSAERKAARAERKRKRREAREARRQARASAG